MLPNGSARAPLEDMKGSREPLDAIRTLSVWKRGGQRAPHKPLLLLVALGRDQRGEPRLVDFNEIETPLKALLERFGPPRRSQRPEYPFWWLQTDGLWEVPHGEDLPRRGKGKEPLVSAVRERHVQGGLPASVDSAFRTHPERLRQAATELLAAHFPSSLHGDICDAVGLDLADTVTTTRRRRDPAFAERILLAYEHRCAMCGYRAILDGMTVAIEAAHVRWHASGGPSSIDNGLALCPVHHKLLDLGAFGISEERRILVSSRLTDLHAPEREPLPLAGQALRGPQKGFPSLNEMHVRWHLKEVFRGPPRRAG